MRMAGNVITRFAWKTWPFVYKIDWNVELYNSRYVTWTIYNSGNKNALNEAEKREHCT